MPLLELGKLFHPLSAACAAYRGYLIYDQPFALHDVGGRWLATGSSSGRWRWLEIEAFN